MIVNLFSWCVFGLIAGAISRLLVPGRDPMGWMATVGVGVTGSFVAGAISHVLFAASNEGVQPADLIGSVIGGILVLVVTRSLRRPHSTIS